MNRFFVNKHNILEDKGQIIIDDGEDVKHIGKVLRLSDKDKVEICDGNNVEYIGEITSINKSEIIVDILEKRIGNRESDIEITLYQGIPKSSKMETIVQKATELGVHRIVPMITSRTIVQLKDEKSEFKKVQRWQKIADEASKQCKRGVIPKIEDPQKFDEVVKNMEQYDLSIIPYEQEEESGLKSLLKDKWRGKRIAIMIGPEGGFEEEEVLSAHRVGVIPVTLGPRILRTETAGLVALSILMYEIGDLGGK